MAHACRAPVRARALARALLTGGEGMWCIEYSDIYLCGSCYLIVVMNNTQYFMYIHRYGHISVAVQLVLTLVLYYYLDQEDG